MNETQSGTLTFVFLLLLGVWYWGYENKQEKDVLQSKLYGYQSALINANENIDEANSTIENLNSSIEDARGEAWSDYDNMGSTLENLETGGTVNTVPEPF